VLLVPELNYGTWAGLFASVWMKVATLLAVLALVYHAWVGVRDIFMDYIKPVGLRLTLQAAAVAVLIAYLGWTIQLLWGVKA
jgi:succinate dehydrogenase / fumarate reductase membrane anchor subunit